ncbi:MAG TPA: metallophosphoesterase [Woeseiaceae bacterium]|nr:metallophosphoesterase [Woeseiaceae bacterium]
MGALRFVTLAAALVLTAATVPAAEWRFDDVDRIVAISDVHGAYPAMLRTLQHAGILDDELAWKGGETHLVVNGDLLDRGPQSRDAMDLLMRLEGEAAQAGGQVHVLLGNHEVMNLVGDLRYVSRAEFAAFADEETPEERERWYAAAVERDPDLTREVFDETAPPGFFAHRRAFGPEGRYGAWLLQKPLLIVVDGTAFVHGGLSPVVAEQGLDGINRDMRGRVIEYVQHLHTLIEAGYLLPTDSFYEHAERLAALPADQIPTPELEDAAESLIRLNAADVHQPDSPLWYRGNVACPPLIETARLDAALRKVGAVRAVIGHTPTPGRGVLERLGGRIYEIDTGMLSDYFGGSGHALVLEGDRLTVVAESDDGATEAAAHPPRLDRLPEGIPAAELASILASGDIVSSSEEDGRTVVTLLHDDDRIKAVFVPNPRTRGVVPELAAYRLDRLLGLDMVPVTVARKVDGKKGVLQLVPASTIDERQRAESGAGGGAWCSLPLQWQAMYAFDALIFNPARVQERIRYLRPDWQLVLSGHDGAFAPHKGRPRYLRNAEIALDAAWIEALTSIDDDVLQAELGDVLDSRRLKALSERRDELLREARRVRQSVSAGRPRS